MKIADYGLRTVVVLALALLSACATPADPAKMVASTSQAGFPTALHETMCVRAVTGGEETNPLWASKVSNKDFQTALTASMKSAGLIADSVGCRFPVDANLLGLNQPVFGINLEVTSHVNYKTFGPSGQPILLTTESAAYTAGFSDSPIAVVRLKMANEGSIRNNIMQYLEKLRGVTIP